MGIPFAEGLALGRADLLRDYGSVTAGVASEADSVISDIALLGGHRTHQVWSLYFEGLEAVSLHGLTCQLEYL